MDSKQAEWALAYGSSLSTFRCEHPGRKRTISPPNPNPRPAARVQSCHSSNKHTPKPPRPRIQPAGEWHLSLVGSQLGFLRVGSLHPDGLKQIPVSVTNKCANGSRFSRGHGTTRIPRVLAEPTTVLAMASSRRCLRCSSVALIFAISNTCLRLIVPTTS